MATRTTVKSGNWSDPTVWNTGVPVDGDAFAIAAGHQIVFDVDQSGMAAGMAASTMAANSSLRFTTAENTTTFLKMNGNVAGSGSSIADCARICVGNSAADPIPKTSRATVQFSAANTQFTGIYTAYAFGCIPERMHTTVTARAESGTKILSLSEDLDLQTGDVVAIGTSAVWGRMTGTLKGRYTVASYDAATRTLTLNEPLEEYRKVGDCVGRVSHPVTIQRPTYYAQRIFFTEAQGTCFRNGAVAMVGTAAFCSFENCNGYTASLVYFRSHDLVLYNCEATLKFHGTYETLDVLVIQYSAVMFTWSFIKAHDFVFQNITPNVFLCCTGHMERFRVVPSDDPLDISPGIRGSAIARLDATDCDVNFDYTEGDYPRSEDYRAMFTQLGSFTDPDAGMIAFLDGLLTKQKGMSHNGSSDIWRTWSDAWCWDYNVIDVRVTFPAGVPMRFGSAMMRCLRPTQECRIQIVDPQNDPFNDYLDPYVAREDGTYMVPFDARNLAEARCPDGPLDTWIDFGLTYTSPTTKELIVRFWYQGYITVAEEDALEWDYVPELQYAYVDLKFLHEGLTGAAHVPRTTDCRYCP